MTGRMDHFVPCAYMAGFSTEEEMPSRRSKLVFFRKESGLSFTPGSHDEGMQRIADFGPAKKKDFTTYRGGDSDIGIIVSRFNGSKTDRDEDGVAEIENDFLKSRGEIRNGLLTPECLEKFMFFFAYRSVFHPEIREVLRTSGPFGYLTSNDGLIDLHLSCVDKIYKIIRQYGYDLIKIPNELSSQIFFYYVGQFSIRIHRG